ncbi:hypothetical protein, partial [Paraburkholderia sp. Ac-20347]|uniref:hypothetical protein n=1 Tax=Paraburkholderia sp. Ac-20347 TaxID=2703892 RepID=UPI00197E2453
MLHPNQRVHFSPNSPTPLPIVDDPAAIPDHPFMADSVEKLVSQRRCDGVLASRPGLSKLPVPKLTPGVCPDALKRA